MSDTREAHAAKIRPAASPIAIFTLVVFAGYATYAVAMHHGFRTGGYDLGIFDQAVRDYARFRPPVVPIRGEGFPHLGDHFHPIVAVLAPLYWFWDDPRALVVAQAALVSSAIPVVHRFAWRRLQHWSAWAVTVGFALGWPIQQLVRFHFHEVAFAVPLLVLAVDALDRRTDRTLVAACAGLLLVREDMGLLVALIGLLRIATRPRVPGAALMVGGLTAFVVVTQVLLPALSPTGEWGYWSYDELGEDAPSALVTILTDPGRALHLAVTPSVKQGTWLALFVPLLFLPLLSRYVLLTLPLLAGQFLSSRELLWIPSYHYWAPVWALLVLAAVDALTRVRRLNRAAVPAVPLLLAGLTLLGIALIPVRYPLQDLLTGQVFSVDEHEGDQRAVLVQIPSGTCVEAHNALIPHLTRTNKVSLPGVMTDPPPDFVALDLTNPDLADTTDGQKSDAGRDPTPAESRQEALDEGYRVLWSQGNMVLLQSPDYAGPSDACAP